MYITKFKTKILLKFILCEFVFCVLAYGGENKQTTPRTVSKSITMESSLSFVVWFQELRKNCCYPVWVIWPGAIWLILVHVHALTSLAAVLIFVTRSFSALVITLSTLPGFLEMRMEFSLWSVEYKIWLKNHIYIIFMCKILSLEMQSSNVLHFLLLALVCILWSDLQFILC